MENVSGSDRNVLQQTETIMQKTVPECKGNANLFAFGLTVSQQEQAPSQQTARELAGGLATRTYRDHKRCHETVQPKITKKSRQRTTSDDLGLTDGIYPLIAG